MYYVKEKGGTYLPTCTTIFWLRSLCICTTHKCIDSLVLELLQLLGSSPLCLMDIITSTTTPVTSSSSRPMDRGVATAMAMAEFPPPSLPLTVGTVGDGERAKLPFPPPPPPPFGVGDGE